MKRIFITGMSGTGKSSVIEALRSRGFATIDTDYDDWCEPSVLDGHSEMIWREDRMFELLAMPLTSPLLFRDAIQIKASFINSLTTKCYSARHWK